MNCIKRFAGALCHPSFQHRPAMPHGRGCCRSRAWGVNGAAVSTPTGTGYSPWEPVRVWDKKPDTDPAYCQTPLLNTEPHSLGCVCRIYCPHLRSGSRWLWERKATAHLVCLMPNTDINKLFKFSTNFLQILTDLQESFCACMIIAIILTIWFCHFYKVPYLKKCFENNWSANILNRILFPLSMEIQQ